MGGDLKRVVSFQEALDNLSSVLSINLKSPYPIGIIRNNHLITNEDEFGPDTNEWLSEEGVDPIFKLLDTSYLAIYSHFLKLMKDNEGETLSPEERKEIASVMELVAESADHIEKVLELRLERPLDKRVRNQKAFCDLEQLYQERFAEELAQEEELFEKEDSKFFLNSLVKVQQDADYELFYIRDEESNPYFAPNILREMKLARFDQNLDAAEEDPMLQVRAMQDRDFHATAAQILDDCYPVVSDFYHQLRSYQDDDFGKSLGMAVLALFLAANPRYLLQNTEHKSCFEYFADFHRYLRRALRTAEYQKWIAYPPDSSDQRAHLLLYLTHSLCKSLFQRKGGIKLESIALLHRSMRKGSETKKTKKQSSKEESLKEKFLIEDDNLRSLLAHFPSGPIFKILDLIQEEEGEGIVIPFDPIGQDNLPSLLLNLSFHGKKTTLLKMACPTRQTLIHRAEIIDEFYGFLRALEKGEQKILLINLQDKNSFKEEARVKALEKLSKQAEFSDCLILMSLPKRSSFYEQTKEYLHLNEASEFFKETLKVLESFESNGFFFPKELSFEKLKPFFENSLSLIHEIFFEKEKMLSQEKRQIFLEIFNVLLILKCLDLSHPDFVTFLCKDAVDVSSFQNALFYALLQEIKSGFSEEKQHDFFRFLLYTPAFFQRERAPFIKDSQLVFFTFDLFKKGFEKDRGKRVKDLKALYSKDFFEKLEIQDFL